MGTALGPCPGHPPTNFRRRVAAALLGPLQLLLPDSPLDFEVTVEQAWVVEGRGKMRD